LNSYPVLIKRDRCTETAVMYGIVIFDFFYRMNDGIHENDTLYDNA